MNYRLFKEGSLWLAKPETLNDPFDCQIDIDSCIRRSCKKTGLEYVKWSKIQIGILGLLCN